MPTIKELLRTRRKVRGRIKLHGTAERPRLVVFRSLLNNYAQLIDDDSGKTLASASDMKMKKGNKSEKAKEVGIEIAKKAKELKIETCIFDKNGYKYHGRVKILADGAREGGLKF